MTKLLVCGSRDWRDSRIVDWVLTGAFTHQTVGYLTTDMDHLYLIEGGARGADRLAAVWARDCPLHGPYINGSAPYLDGDEPGVIHVPYPARWKEHDFEGTSGVKCVKGLHLCMPGVFPCRRAGARRNQRMLDDQKPDYVIAFKDGFNARVGRGGTEDMVNRAKGVGVTTYVISHG